MKKERISKLFERFEGIARAEQGVEFWLARELQPLLGYTEWRNFDAVLDKAKTACGQAGQRLSDHFVEVNKMVGLGSGASRSVDDVALTRYACYLIAQNGDPRKEAIAFAQTYFAVQTRRQELIEQRLAEAERVRARARLAESETSLSQVIFERLRRHDSFAKIRSRGDHALFGGLSTKQMKDRLGVPGARPLADFLPTVTIKAKDLANEITVHNTKEHDLRTEPAISREHVQNNAEVRKVLSKRGIRPEDLPPAEDVKQVQRRIQKERRSLELDAPPGSPDA
ncbi:MAG: DNA damage-inducible protein D [Planctomycetes bacterium]|nr:DNA damage-inducible protein D [Planctomycetota bacterium]